MVRLLAWFGAAGLSAAPFIIDTTFGKWLAVTSIVCLTIQAISLRAWNLVAMNTVSIVGYLYVLHIRP